MIELERSIAAYAEFLDEQSLTRSADHNLQSDGQGDVIVVDIQPLETSTDQSEEETGWRWLHYTILAAAAVIVVIVAVALFDGNEETSEVDVIDSPADVDAPVPTEQVTPEPTEQVTPSEKSDDPLAFTSGDALEMVEALFVAIETGDAEALADAFLPDALANVDAWVTEQVWAAATGTVFSFPRCETSEQEPGSFLVICGPGSKTDYLNQLVDAPVGALRADFTVTAEGFQRVALLDVSGFELPADSAFSIWMLENHRQDREAATGLAVTSETSIEEARTYGELRRQYADLWADYLTQTGCTWDELGC